MGEISNGDSFFDAKEGLRFFSSLQADQSLNSLLDIILFTMDKSARSDREPRIECGTGRLAEILTHWSLHTPGALGRGNNDHKVFTSVWCSNDPL